MSRWIAACSIILAAATTPAAGSVLDQSNDVSFHIGGVSFDVGPTIGGKNEVSQSFTVGTSGLLDRADLFLSGTLHQDLLLEIRRTTPDGLPSEAPSALIGAAIREITPGPLPFYNWVEFHLNGPTVTAGEQLALVLKVPGSSGIFSWFGEPNGTYGGGKSGVRNSATLGQWSVGNNPNRDLGFRTYVEPVPEPTTLSIFVGGGIGAIAVARRRRRQG